MREGHDDGSARSWVQCRSCQLNHAARDDGSCPRCGALASADPGPIEVPGYEGASGHYDPGAPIDDDGTRDLIVGGLWCLGGTVVTVATWSMASGGGSYVVAWGAILFGGIQFVRGLARKLSS